MFASRGHLGQHRRRAHGKAEPVRTSKASTAPQTQPPGAGAAAVVRATPACWSPNLVRVSPAIVALPWIKFSRNAGDCAHIVARLDGYLSDDDAMTDAERAFWVTLRAHVAAIAQQAAAS